MNRLGPLKSGPGWGHVSNRASVHQAAKLVAALLRVARVTAGLVESNGSFRTFYLKNKLCTLD